MVFGLTDSSPKNIMTPILNSDEGLTIDTGEVTTNLPALLLKQKVNDGGEAKFAVLQIEADNTTEDEQLDFIRGYKGGVEAFQITGSGTFIGQSAIFSVSVATPFSTLTNDTLNINSKTIVRADGSGNVGFLGAAPVAKPVLGAATAASTYGANERDMLQKVYNALRTLGLAT